MEMTTITIKVPSDVADAFGATPEEQSRFATEALAIEAYRRVLLANGSLGAIVGVPRVDFPEWLAERNVPSNRTVGDLVEGYNAGKKFTTSQD